uniref:Uncharacterized protein n=1 Tax=Rhipicephalus appendiculatus TaxID=34631 RepID=A0A131YAC6_RHIAP
MYVIWLLLLGIIFGALALVGVALRQSCSDKRSVMPTWNSYKKYSFIALFKELQVALVQSNCMASLPASLAFGIEAPVKKRLANTFDICRCP